MATTKIEGAYSDVAVRERYLAAINTLDGALQGGNAPQGKAALKDLQKVIKEVESGQGEVGALFDDASLKKLEQARQRGWAAGIIPDIYFTSLRQFVDAGINRTNEAKGVDQSAQVKAQVEAAAPEKEGDQPVNWDEMRAQAKTQVEGVVEQLREQGATDAQVDQQLEMYVANFSNAPDLTPDMKAVVEELKAARESIAADREKIQAMMSDKDFVDAIKLMSGQPESPELRTKIREIADKSGLKPSQVRNELIGQMQSASASPEAKAELNAALDKLASSPEPGMKHMAEAIKTGLGRGSFNAADVDSIMKSVVGQDPTGLLFSVPDGLPADTAKAMTELQRERIQFAQDCDMKYDELMGLIHSGLPIELVVMLFMLAIQDLQEKKLKRIMREMAAAEAANKDTDRIEKRRAQIEAEVSNPKIDPARKKTLETELSGLTAQAEAVAGARRMAGLKEDTSSLTQILQFEQTKLAKLFECFANMLRVLQDMWATPIRNIR
jgi:hypothetical protein